MKVLQRAHLFAASALILAFGASSEASAENWVYVSGDWTKTYYDALGAYQIEDDQWLVRVLNDDIAPSATTFGPSEVYEAIFDCRLPRFRPISSTWYSGAMATGQVTQYFDTADQPWIRITLATDGMIRELLCNY